jgi:chemotaxis protein histidine kinase CheA
METASPFGESPDQEANDAISNAEAAVAALADSFLEWIAEDISNARNSLENAKSRPDDNNGDLQAIFGVMHNLKGQGSSFGFNMLTHIAESLCGYIRDAEGSADEHQLKVVAAHFAAIDFVIEKNIKGDGGEIGKPLMAKLETLKTNVPKPA